MTKTTRRELMETTKKRYLKANKKQRQVILNEFCSNTDYLLSRI